MKQILWFRRDLRIEDSAILANAKDEVLPIFIFDKNILDTLPKDDKRVSFIYQSVITLKEKLKNIGLDLAVFYSTPKEVFTSLKSQGFDEVLCSIDFDDYSKKRDIEVESVVCLKRFLDSFILNPNDCLKKDGTPYKVFTPFYKSLRFLWESEHIKEYERNTKLKKIAFEYEKVPSLEEMGFEKVNLPDFLSKSASELIKEFKEKIKNYKEARDLFYKEETSKLSVHLRFGLICAKQVFNEIKKIKNIPTCEADFFIRELFWREFYNYILFHFPRSEFENFNETKIIWKNDKKEFEAWCEGNTGVPLIDAAMKYLNKTGLMHNRLRMIVASYLTKNLFIDWRWGEKYFAKKLLDYEASSNIGSWQWAASTGADSVPYFRVFNPYLQSKKFDKEAIFIKSILKSLQEVDSKTLHQENGVQNSLFVTYPSQLVSIDFSRKRAIENFKKAKKETTF